MSLARKHRDRVLASQMASAPVQEGGLSASGTGTPAERAAASIAMRLQHDLRRLKEIKSIDRRIGVKREMLPAYADWVAGLLQGGRDAGAGVAEDVLPTVMIWKIDTGDYAGALDLAEHVLRYDVPLPTRYERDAASLVTELIADQAIRAQTACEPFPIDILETVEALTADADMHDQIRAKLNKAIGAELARAVDGAGGEQAPAIIDRACAALIRAQALDDRIGVKTILRGLEKTKAALTKIAEGDSLSPTGVGGGRPARPAKPSTQPPSGDVISAAKVGNDAISHPEP